MTKVYLLRCRDVGIDCDFQASGASLEEVMERSATHGAERHGLKGFGPELYLKMHRAVQEVDQHEAPVQRSSPSLPVDLSLDVTTELAGTVQVVHAVGRLDSTTADGFDARIQQLVATQGIRVVLDLAQINYVSSAGLRSLLMLMKQVKALGGVLLLAAVHPRVRDILDIAGFTDMFTIVPTPADALARLQTTR